MIPLPGDWAARPMYRVTLPDGRSAVRIETVPDDDPKSLDGHRIGPVATILRFLREKGLRVPEVYEADPEKGVLVLEDFGDVSWARWTPVDPYDQVTLYPQALAVLRDFRSIKPDPALGIPDFANSYIYGRTVWFLTEYKTDRDSSKRKDFVQIWDALLETLPQDKHFVHGDFHPGNLMKLADGGLGVLDVGGAFWGSGLYDLVNLLEDIRRDVSDEIKTRAKADYGFIDEDAYAVLHAQFYTRLLGQMTRRGMNIPRKIPLTLESLVHRHQVLTPLKPLVLG